MTPQYIDSCIIANALDNDFCRNAIFGCLYK